MQKLIGSMVNKPPTALAYAPSSTFVLPACFIGVEVEVEGVHRSIIERMPDSIQPFWTTHNDESLRNNGLEFVFTIPLFGKDIEAAIRALCDVGVKNKFVISQRTGIHVHLDVRDLTGEQFLLLACTYALVEKPIYNWVGDCRENNHFCLPWYTAQGDLRKVSAAIADTGGRSKRNLETLHRYTGCNAQALAIYGSLEFRHLKTTFNAERLIKWVNILMSLKKYAITSKFSPIELCNYAQQAGAKNLLIDVFGPTIAEELWYPAYATDIYEYGMISVEEFIEGLPKTISPELQAKKFENAVRKMNSTTGPNEGYAKFMQKIGKASTHKETRQNIRVNHQATPRVRTTEELLRQLEIERTRHRVDRVTIANAAPVFRATTNGTVAPIEDTMHTEDAPVNWGTLDDDTTIG